MQAVGPKYEGEPTVEALANGLASLGRYGDSYMVHAAEGETVVPKEVLEANPGLKNQLLWQMKMMGIENPNRYVVGSEFNSINPVTGQPEFFFKKVFKAVKNVFKKVLPVAAPIIGNMIAPGIGGPVAAALSAKLTGGSMSDALKQAAFAYGAQTLGSGIMGAVSAQPGSGMSGFMEGLKSGALAPIEAASNIFASGPTNPLQQGIFGTVNQGTRGLNMDTLFPQYDAQGGSMAMRGVQPDAFPGSEAGFVPEGTVSTAAAKAVPSAVTPAAAGSAGAAVGTKAGTGFLSGISSGVMDKLKVAGILGAGGLALGALTQEEVDMLEGLGSNDPRRSAYDEYKNMTPEQQRSEAGIALLRQAGIGPKYGYEDLARITGITPQAAQQYQMGRYGFTMAAGGAVNGPGTGTSDSIPAMLSDGEFVMTAKAVDGAGGPAQMYRMMSEFEKRAGYG